MAPLRYEYPASVVLDGAGGGQAQAFAGGSGETVVTLQSLSTGTAAKVPTARVYRNFVSPANYIEGSYTGSNDSSDTRVRMQPGESLICVWLGGDAGTTATYRISGWLYPPGQAPAE